MKSPIPVAERPESDQTMNGKCTTARSALLARGAAAVGQSWALAIRDALHEEHRRAAGGWPATLSQARSMVPSRLSPWLAGRGEQPVSETETESAARLVYACARKTWLAHRESDEP
jgi:hypothetical protein